NTTCAENRRAAEVKKDICHLRRGIYRSTLQRICHCIRHRNHENEIGQRKSCCSRPIAPEKQENSRSKTAKERDGQKKEGGIVCGCPSSEGQPVSEQENAETAGQCQDAEGKISDASFRQLITPKAKEVPKHKGN